MYQGSVSDYCHLQSSWTPLELESNSYEKGEEGQGSSLKLRPETKPDWTKGTILLKIVKRLPMYVFSNKTYLIKPSGQNTEL